MLDVRVGGLEGVVLVREDGEEGGGLAVWGVGRGGRRVEADERGGCCCGGGGHCGS